jgi:hypothetical protein
MQIRDGEGGNGELHLRVRAGRAMMDAATDDIRERRSHLISKITGFPVVRGWRKILT